MTNATYPRFMVRCQANPSFTRHEIDGFKFPLGVYPVEKMTPRAGYTVEFEQSDGLGEGEATGDNGPEWEEWPDRYVYDIVVSADRVEALWRALLSQFPGRAYPILDFIGHDAYREIDPYIAYELVGLDRVIEGVERCRDFLFEDGMVGFGVMLDEPFLYVFIDEHKIVTVRCEPLVREQIDRVLAAFDLGEMDEPAGADAAAHEHRTVLLAPPDRPDLLSGEEAVERLREAWRLTLNVDPETNIDDDGRELGMTNWRCLVRCSTEAKPQPRYAEVFIGAQCLGDAEDLAQQGAWTLIEGEEAGEWSEVVVVAADRVRPEQAVKMLQDQGEGASKNQHKVLQINELDEEMIFAVRLLA